MVDVLVYALRGSVVRTVTSTARTRTEEFTVIYEDPSWPASTREHVDGDVVAEGAFAGSSDAPIMLWDGALPEQAQADPRSWFDGNVFREEPPAEVIDVSGLRPLEDDEFWPVIDSLGGRMWDRTIQIAVSVLAQQDEDFILRWEETAARKALVLADAFEKAGIAAARELHSIGAVLGKGEEAFLRVYADPKTFDWAWVSDNSPQVIWIGSHALERRLGRSVRIESSMSLRHRDILERRRLEVAEYQREHGIVERPRDPSLTAARGIVDGSNGLRERLVLVPSSLSKDQEATAAMTADGSRLVAGPEFANHQSIGLWGGVAFSVRRRTALPLDEYITRYVTRP
ncbi:hypothetical protein [Microbacterium sulfonylureivorans]|uniref:hypothetical protein n=1 Tax=Microbacterium sulfonylureivorans TaxID=2486854 RepID=UPI000FD88A2A|nr:hypothetical protein [Microbacterium sulfonylureivorans]